MRDAFSRNLVQAALADPRVMLLTGDHGYALFDEFRRVCPEQYINAGVAEQNMVGVAAGLAKGGFRPVVYGLSAFVPIRVLEQIKLDVCYEQLPVVFIGDGAGVVYGQLGSSHQSTEDIAALRALPNMAILSPADAYEMTACLKLAFEPAGPVYLRMGKADLGAIHTSPPLFDWGGLCQIARAAGRVAWIATGSMVTTAMAVAADWPDSAVWSAPCIKPLGRGASCRDLPAARSGDRVGRALGLRRPWIGGGRNCRSQCADVDLPHRHRGSLFRALRQLCLFDARAWNRRGVGARQVERFLQRAGCASSVHPSGSLHAA